MNPASPKQASEQLRFALQAKLNALVSETRNINTGTCRQMLAQYEKLLHLAQKLFETTQQSCSTDEGRACMQFLIASETGQYDAPPMSRAILFHSIGEEYTRLYGVAMRGDNTLHLERALALLLPQVRDMPALGMAAAYFLYSFYGECGKDMLAFACDTLDLNDAAAPYFKANMQSNAAACAQNALQGFVAEFSQKAPHENAIVLVLGQMDAFIRSIFCIPFSGTMTPATQSKNSSWQNYTAAAQFAGG